MNYTKLQNAARLLLVGASLISAGTSRGTDIWLRTGVVTNTMPDGQAVVFWAFAQDSANWAVPGPLTVPGPQLNVAAGDTLVLHVTNTLPEPVSIVIPGQYGFDSQAPAFFTDGPYVGRARSLNHEAAPGNGVATYTWMNVQSGTFLYHSGSHPSVQVQMGLYGALAVTAVGPQIYAGVHFDVSATVLLSEVDAKLHATVAGGGFGPGPAFLPTDFPDPVAFIDVIFASADPVAQWVMNNISGDPASLADDLNNAILLSSIYDPALFPDSILEPVTLALMRPYPALNQDYTPTARPFMGDLVRLNRMLLYDGLANAGIAIAPPKMMSSASRAKAQYFMINGQPYTNGQPPMVAGTAGSTTLLRLLNAGMDLRTPTLNNGGDLLLVGEDGQQAPYPRRSAVVFLPALKTVDALWTPAAAGNYAVYDRHLGLQSSPTGLSGGMLAYLAVPAMITNASLALAPAPGGLQLTVTSPPGAVFVIESSPDLIVWTPVATVTNITGLLNYPLVNTGAPGIFYRAVLLNSGTIGGSALPLALVPPANQTVPEFSTATWTVVANGSGLTYQWLSNGVVIAGANATSYSLTNVKRTDSGEVFSVVVTSSASISVTNSATLTVVPAAPFIATQPANTNVTTPGAASFSVVAGGSTPMTYQWFKADTASGPFTNVVVNGANISGATTNTLRFSATDPTNGGFYQVVVTGPVVSTPGVFVAGAGATAMSVPAELGIAPAIPPTQPVDVIVADQANATFSVAATGTGLTYQWYREAPGSGTWVLIAGATNASYTFQAFYSVDNQSHYHVVVTGDTGMFATSRSALLTVGQPPINSVVFLTSPASVTNNAGVASVTFTATVDARSGASFVWYRLLNNGSWSQLGNGNNNGGYFTTNTSGNTSTLRVASTNNTSINLAQAGVYEVRVNSSARASAGLTVIQTFAGSRVTDIPAGAGGSATPYPARTASVPALTGASLEHASVTLTLTDPEPFDADMLIATPDGARSVEFMAGVGPAPAPGAELPTQLYNWYGVSNCVLTFDDSAPAQVSTNYWLASGTYQPTVFPMGTNWMSPLPVDFPAPVRTAGIGKTFSTLNNYVPAAGRWGLYINDNASDIAINLPVGQTEGSIPSWSLMLTVGPQLVNGVLPQ